MSLIEPLRTEVVLKSDYDALAKQLGMCHIDQLNAEARIRELEAALRAVRPACLEYCDNADIIDKALASSAPSEVVTTLNAAYNAALDLRDARARIKELEAKLAYAEGQRTPFCGWPWEQPYADGFEMGKCAAQDKYETLLAEARKEAAAARELLRDAREELGPEVDVTGPAIDAHLAKYAGGSVAETTGKHP